MCNMNMPLDKDLDWLRKSLDDPTMAINVVINGHVDEITGWLPGLLRRLDAAEAVCARVKKHPKNPPETLDKLSNWEAVKEGRR